ncbi:MAG TPA: hypothetical protein VGW38_10410 [Chloroflexota bacterium]|nr:hypothetical protein [Chloroflexota bacterium]
MTLVETGDEGVLARLAAQSWILLSGDTVAEEALESESKAPAVRSTP